MDFWTLPCHSCTTHGNRKTTERQTTFTDYQLLCLRLYVDPSKLPKEVSEHLASSGVEVADYSSMVPDVVAFAKEGKTLWLDPSKV